MSIPVGKEARGAASSALEGYPETLPASWYCSDQVYALEQERIFRRNWFLLAREQQLTEPRSYVAADVHGVSVIVVRNQDGGLSGFLNCCRHRAGRLLEEGEGTLSDGFRCRYHGWRYELSGELKLAPGFSRACGFDPSEFGLFKIRVGAWNGLIFVALSDSAQSLPDWLGDIVEIAQRYPGTADLEFLKIVEVDGAANWKLYGENGVEGYHVAFVHSWLLEAVGPSAYEVEIHENGRFVGFPVEYKAWNLERPFKGYWILKYPGLLLHFSELEFNCEQVIPTNVRRTHLKHWFWAPKGNPVVAENVARDWTTTMQEDMRICEEVQSNLEAGIYRNGRMTPARERGAIYFQSLVREALADF